MNYQQQQQLRQMQQQQPQAQAQQMQQYQQQMQQFQQQQFQQFQQQQMQQMQLQGQQQMKLYQQQQSGQAARQPGPQQPPLQPKDDRERNYNNSSRNRSRSSENDRNSDRDYENDRGKGRERWIDARKTDPAQKQEKPQQANAKPAPQTPQAVGGPPNMMTEAQMAQWNQWNYNAMLMMQYQQQQQQQQQRPQQPQQQPPFPPQQQQPALRPQQPMPPQQQQQPPMPPAQPMMPFNLQQMQPMPPQHPMAPMQQPLPMPKNAVQDMDQEPIPMDTQYEDMNRSMTPEGEPPFVREVLHLRSCTLFPPSPTVPPAKTRPKPLGCRTAFIAGLPENINEDILREIFGRCGEIISVRVNKKNFCHIKFETEDAVMQAVLFSTWRIRIGDEDDKVNTGKLYVDFAQGREDSYELEMRQKQQQIRESMMAKTKLMKQQMQQQLQQQQQQMMMNPYWNTRMMTEPTTPSSATVPLFSDTEASRVSENLKALSHMDPELFSDTVHTLVTWLERGECSNRTSTTFYSLLQSANSHVRRLLTEKQQLEESTVAAKTLAEERGQKLRELFSHIQKVYKAIYARKVWDHFTKAQRKNIDVWKKNASELENLSLKKLLTGNEDAEDDDDDTKMNDADAIEDVKSDNEKLKEEIEKLKGQVDSVKTSQAQVLETKNKQLEVLQQTLRGVHQQMWETRSKLSVKNRTIEKLNDKDDTVTSEWEAQLVGLLSIFLHIHPVGVTVDYMKSYLQCVDPLLTTLTDLNSVLKGLPKLFKQEKDKWFFIGNLKAEA